MQNITAVVVAYNRRTLLVECMTALRDQSRALDSIVVVDNASEDGSAEAVRTAFPSVDVVALARNTGGAGGFAVGIERAITHHRADLVWIMDDDTVPTPTALAELLRARAAAIDPPVAAASRVVWVNGVDHPMNTPRRKPFVARAERRSAGRAGAIPVRSASFVSLLVDADAVRKSGLPLASYFIWNDDFEFTARLLRAAYGLYVPASVVVHKTKALADTDVDPGDRFYYEVRNKVWLFLRSRALHWWEKPIYLAATARRWLNTFLRSDDRARLRRAFVRGWRHGFQSRPQPTAEYLAAMGVDCTSIARFDEAAGRR